MRWLMLACAALTVANVSAHAQIAVGARAGYLDRKLTVQSNVEHQAGMVGGLDIALRAAVVRLSVHGGGGKLSAQSTTTPDVDYGRLEGNLFIAPVPWLGFGGGVNVSAFVSDLGPQRWILPRVGAELRPAFAGIPAEAYVRGLLIVGATTNSPIAPSGGLAVGGGLAIDVAKLQIFLDYQLERLNFDAGLGREEQRGEIAAGARFKF